MGFRRKYWHLLLSLWLLLLPFFSLASDLQFYLDVDRLHFYASNLSSTLAKRGKKDLAEAVKSITPQEIANRKIDPAILRDPKQFDPILEKIVREKYPNLNFTKEDIQWNYNFLKNKLAESFTVTDSKPTSGAPNPEKVPDFREEILSPLDSADVTLDVDQYVADRTTRGLFWYTSKNQLPIELHMGTSREFKDRLEEAGGKIIGEVHPKARNYNKIYILQYPNQPNPVYAITGISGSDRLEHWKQQIALVRWPGTEKNRIPVKVLGEAEPKIYNTKTLISQLEALPKADHVIIGQKGAIGASFRIISRAEALLRFVNIVGLDSLGDLSPEEKRALKKLVTNNNPFSVVGDSNSTWDNLYEKLETRFASVGVAPAVDPEALTVKNDSHSFSDYVFQNEKGKPVRWRVFSNTWGDEIAPIAEALKATGHNKVSYIGTAGAMPDAGLRVGDLFIPTSAMDSEGKSHPLPGPFVEVKGENIGGSVAHVGSPFEETKDWLEAYRKKSKAVELEVYYLAKVFNGKEDRFQANLLISDVVGSEHETLASASSAERKSQLSDLLSALFKDSEAKSPIDAKTFRNNGHKSAETRKLGQLDAEIQTLLAKRDPIYQYQIRQLAIQENVSSSASLKTLTEKWKPFTGADIDQKFSFATESMRNLFLTQPEWKNGQVYLSQDIYSGTWNPKSQKLKVTLQAPPGEEAPAEAALQRFLRGHPDYAKQIEFVFTTGPPETGQLGIPLSEVNQNRYTLLNEYTKSALKNAGLSFEYGPTDKLNFRWLPISEERLAASGRTIASNAEWRSPTALHSDSTSKFSSCTQFFEHIRLSPNSIGSAP